MVEEVEKYRKMKVDALFVPICLFPNKNWDTFGMILYRKLNENYFNISM